MTTHTADAQSYTDRQAARAGSERPKKTGSIQLRIGDDMRCQVETRAAMYDMNLSEYVRHLLVSDLEESRKVSAPTQIETPRERPQKVKSYI